LRERAENKNDVLKLQKKAKQTNFFHDLQCPSGFGDRILDIWATATIARLLEPAARLSIRWSNGLEFQAFSAVYATDLFTINNIQFVNSSPPDSTNTDKRFSRTHLNEKCIIPISPDTLQIVLRGGRSWATSSPKRIFNDAVHYGLNADLDLGEIMSTFRHIATTTVPKDQIARAIPNDAGKRVGIHVRLSDKLVKRESPWDMSVVTWRFIEAKSIACIEQCVTNDEPMLICSDDPDYRDALIQYIRSKGGDAITTALPPSLSNKPGAEALLDFFALASTSRIIQMSKYSTFSMAAALTGNIPLVNLYDDESKAGTCLDVWAATFVRLISSEEELGRPFEGLPLKQRILLFGPRARNFLSEIVRNTRKSIFGK